MTTALTVLVSGVPDSVKKLLQDFDWRDVENEAIDTYEKYRFADYALARMAVMDTMVKMLSVKDRFYARWCLNNVKKDKRNKLQEWDEDREDQQLRIYFENGVLGHQAYWVSF